MFRSVTKHSICCVQNQFSPSREVGSLKIKSKFVLNINSPGAIYFCLLGSVVVVAVVVVLPSSELEISFLYLQTDLNKVR